MDHEGMGRIPELKVFLKNSSHSPFSDDLSSSSTDREKS